MPSGLHEVQSAHECGKVVSPTHRPPSGVVIGYLNGQKCTFFLKSCRVIAQAITLCFLTIKMYVQLLLT
jgi:hypothetical protein